MSNSIRKFTGTAILCVALVLSVVVVIFHQKSVPVAPVKSSIVPIYHIVKASGSSMEPTIQDGDALLTAKEFEIERNDVVIIEDNGLIAKRIIGLPGEHIFINEDGLYIDDELVIPDKDGLFKENEWYNEILLGDDEYYVLGDNYSSSSDSRENGPITEEQIKYNCILTIRAE